MKYIVVSRTVGNLRQEFPVIFPDDLLHADMEAAAKLMVEMLPMPKDAHIGPTVAAGFVMFDSAPRCFGQSTGLNLASRGTEDGLLFHTYDSTHGIKSAVAPSNHG